MFGPNLLLYSEIILDGKDIAGWDSCQNWNVFLNSLAVKSVTMKVVSFDIFVIRSLDDVVNKNYPVVNCDSNGRQIQQYLTNSFNESTQHHLTCVNSIGSTTDVKIASCHGVPTFFLKYNSSISSLASISQFGTCQKSECEVNNPQINIENNSGVIRILRLNFGVVSPAPLLLSVNFTSVSSSSVEVELLLSSNGLVFCIASVIPPSDVSMLMASMSTKSSWSVNNSTSIILDSLAPSTNYSLYCVSMSPSGVSSDISIVLSQRFHFRSGCCKTATMATAMSTVVTGKTVLNFLQINLNFLPSNQIQLTPFAVFPSGLEMQLFYPKTTFLSHFMSPTAVFSFVGSDVVGALQIGLRIKDVSAEEYYSSPQFASSPFISVIGANEKPSVISLKSAHLSNDGSYGIITFTSSTNKPGGTAWFLCSLLFSFRFDISSLCQWSQEGNTLDLIPSVGSSVDVGTTLSLLPNRVKSLCPVLNSSICNALPFVSSITIAFQYPQTPLIPIVSISSPQVIGDCDNLNVDFSSSSGSGGRPWANISVTVNSDAPGILFLQTAMKSVNRFSTIVSILPQLLDRGYSYVFTVTLCNFVGSCSSNSASVIKISLAVPIVSILGSNFITMNTSSSLSLSATVLMSSCDVTSEALNQQQLSISWFTTLKGALVSIQSASRDSSKFILSPFTLPVSSLFSISVTVVNIISKKSSSATVQVFVSPSSLISIISGGSRRSMRVLSSALFDASASYDDGQINHGIVGLQFLWSCFLSSPLFQDNCGLSIDHATTATPKLFTYAGLTSGNTTSVVSMNLFDRTRSKSSTVEVTVFPEVSPSISIAYAQSIDSTFFSVNRDFPIVGTIQFVESALCSWGISYASFDLSKISLVFPTSKITSFSNTTFSMTNFNLVIPANSLPAGSSFTLTLTCRGVFSFVSGFSSIDIFTNAPPRPGNFTVTPSFGFEISTSFSFVASHWVDSDLPLTFQFGYLDHSTSSVLSLQSVSQLNEITSFLPGGISVNNFKVRCIADIFDSFMSNTTIFHEVMVNVKSWNSTQNLNHLVVDVTSRLSNSGISVDVAKQVIATVGSVLNRVNCTHSPNCTLLFRQPCSLTASTCGPCLDSSLYLGISGDSNVACVAGTSYFSQLNFFKPPIRCHVNDECGPLETCNATNLKCIIASKSCPSNCMNNGNCVWKSIVTGLEVSACLITDASCVSSCKCFKDSFGTDCSLGFAEMQSKQRLREILLNNLAIVVNTEFADSLSISSWSKSLLLMTSAPSELTSLAGERAVSIGLTISESAISFSAVSLSSIVFLNFVVDSLWDHFLVNSSSLSSQRRLSDNANDLKSVLYRTGEISTRNMLSGQDPQVSIHNSFRMISSISSLSRVSNEISCPKTLSETTSDYQTARVRFSVSSQAARIVRNTVLSGSLSQSTSPQDEQASLSLTTLFDENSLCQDENSANIVFSIPLISPMRNFTELNKSPQYITTICKLGSVTKSVFLCQNGKHVSTHCNGTHAYKITTLCPFTNYSPQCRITDFVGAVMPTCVVVNISDHFMTCSCSVCKNFNSQRKLLEVSQAALGLVSVTVASANDLVTVVSAAASFSTLAAFESTIIVLVTFLCLWIVLPLLSFVIAVIHNFSQQQNKKKKDKKEEPDPKKFLDSYLDSLLKNLCGEFRVMDVINDVPLYQILAPKSENSFSQNKWLIMFKMLTTLSFGFFALSFFYQIQFPSDSGVCDSLITEHDCLVPKSVLKQSQSLCSWISSPPSDGESGSSSLVNQTQQNAWSCQWAPPQYSGDLVVLFTVLVILASTPIQYCLDRLFADVIFAPTETIPDIGVSKSLRRASRAVIGQVKAVAAKAIVFSKTVEISREVRKSRYIAESAFKKAQYRQIKPVVAAFTSPPTVDLLESCVLRERTSLVGTELLTSFDNDWGVMSMDDGVLHSKFCHDNKISLQIELDQTFRQSEKYNSTLKTLPNTVFGTETMMLFCVDILGRNSRQSKILTNSLKSSVAFDTRLVKWWVKSAAVVLLVILNFGFFYFCLLYAFSKGLAWQYAWLENCIINIVIEVFFNNFTEILILRCIIPRTISSDIDELKSLIKSAFDVSVGAKRNCRLHDFSTSDYFFPSVHLARLRPELLESKLIFAYRNIFVGDLMRKKLVGSSITDASSSKVARNYIQFSPHSLLPSFAFVNIVVLLFQMLGACPMPMQRFFLQVVQPLFLGAIGLMLNSVAKDPVGFSLTIVAIGVVVLFGLWKLFMRYKFKRNAVVMDPSEIMEIVISDSSPDVLTMKIQDVIGDYVASDSDEEDIVGDDISDDDDDEDDENDSFHSKEFSLSGNKIHDHITDDSILSEDLYANFRSDNIQPSFPPSLISSSISDDSEDFLSLTRHSQIDSLSSIDALSDCNDISTDDIDENGISLENSSFKHIGSSEDTDSSSDQSDKVLFFNFFK